MLARVVVQQSSPLPGFYWVYLFVVLRTEFNPWIHFVNIQLVSHLSVGIFIDIVMLISYGILYNYKKFASEFVNAGTENPHLGAVNEDIILFLFNKSTAEAHKTHF